MQTVFEVCPKLLGHNQRRVFPESIKKEAVRLGANVPVYGVCFCHIGPIRVRHACRLFCLNVLRKPVELFQHRLCLIARQDFWLVVIVCVRRNEMDVLDSIIRNGAFEYQACPQRVVPNHVTDEIAKTVDDAATAMMFDAAQDMRVVADDYVGAGINQAPGNSDLLG